MRRAMAKRLVKLDGVAYNKGDLLPTDLDAHTYELLRKRNQMEWVEAPPPEDEDAEALTTPREGTLRTQASVVQSRRSDGFPADGSVEPQASEDAATAPEDEAPSEPTPDAEEPAEEPESTDEADAEFPVHEGGGWYRLSNGETVRGKDEAVAAEAALTDE